MLMSGAFSFFPDGEIIGRGDGSEGELCWPGGGTYVGKVKLLLSPIVMWQFLVCIHLCYCNFLTGFWSSCKGILVHISLLSGCFCGDEGLDFLSCHLADVTLCLVYSYYIFIHLIKSISCVLIVFQIFF